MKTSFEIRSKIAELKAAYRALFDGINEENKADTEAKAETVMAEIDSLETRAANFEKIEASDAAFETRSKAKRPTVEATVISAGADEVDSEGEGEQVRAFLKGEKRALNSTSGASIIPTHLASSITTALSTYSAVVSVASSITTSDGAVIDYPYSDDTAQKGTIISEGGDHSGGTDPVLSSKPLGAYTFSSKTIPVANNLLQDAAFDVSGFVSGVISERIGRALNDKFTNGTGPANNQPEGIAYVANVAVTTAANTTVTGDELIDLQHSVDAAYRANAKFMMNDKTLAAFRKLKTTDGQYLVSGGLNSNVPLTLLGQPVQINPDMPDIAAGAKAVLYGDFSKVVVRYTTGYQIKRFDDSKYAELDQTGFLGLGRFDCLLTDAKAVRALKLKA